MTTTVIGQATGIVGVSGDSDWFKVSLTAGTQYVFNQIGALPNGQMALYDASGNAVIAGVSNSAGQVIFDPTASGTYYVGVSAGAGSTGTYTVLESTPSLGTVSANVNTTGALSVGGSATGSLAITGQHDWYKVSLTAGTGYQFNLSSTDLGSGQVAVYDAAGNYIVSGNDNNTNLGNSVFFVPTTTGTYYIDASDTGGGTGNFNVSAVTAPFGIAGNINTTGSVTVGGSATGAIAYAGQSDWFKVSLTAGSQYVFDVSGQGVIPSIALYDSTGKQITGTYVSDGSGGDLISFEPSVSGTYFIGAAGVASTTGSVTVSVNTATPDVLGNILTTGTVTVGGSTHGTLATATQSDWYKVTLTAGTHYEVSLGGGTLSGSIVTVYDANGNALTTGTGNAANGGAAAYFEPSATGTYFIGASAPGAATGTFIVSVATTTADFDATTATTGTVAVGGTASGNLTNAGQSDWYKVSLTAGTEYSFGVSGALGSPGVALYDSNGALITSSPGGASSTSYTPSSSGTYYVSASSQTGGTGAFSVAVNTVTDDFAGNSSTTGTFTAPLTAAAAIAEFQAHTLTSAAGILDSGANIQANLNALQTLAAANLIGTISLSDLSAPTITVTPTQIASDAAVLNSIATPFALAVSGFSSTVSTFEQNTAYRYIPGTNHSGSNQVVEISSVTTAGQALNLGGGFNVVLIDGDHSIGAGSGGTDAFSFNVESNGTVNLLDNNTGKSITITGDTYLMFDGGARNGDGSYQSIVFVGSAINGEVTSLYNAAFLRQPDLAGLEYYVAPITAGTLTLHQTAVNFIASQEFQNDFPTAAAPSDHGGANDTAFVNTLYQNVLNRAPGASELSFYTAELAAGSIDRAQILINFALSPENQAAVSGLLVNVANGAYGDSNDLLSASTVFNDVKAGGVLNTAAIDPTTIGTGVTANNISSDSSDTLTLSSHAPVISVQLSPVFANIIVQNSGSTVIDSGADSTITLAGADSTTLGLGHGGQDTVNLLGGTNTIINNFVPGSGTTLNVANTNDPTTVQLLNGATAPVSGAALTFNSGSSYVVEIGTVSASTAAAVATQANKAYVPASTAGEFVTFLTQDAAGNTEVWFWGSTAGASKGVIPQTSLASGADVNGNHLVDAAELVHVATIVGVLPSALTVNDLA